MADALSERPAPANEVPPAETPTPASLMTLAVGAAVAAALYVAQDVLLPLVLAVLLAFVLAPFVDLLRRWRFGRMPADAVAVLFALSVIGALTATIGLQVAQLAADLPRYESTIRAKVEGVKGGIVGRASDFVRHLGREIERATEDKAPARPPVPSPETRSEE